MPRNKYPQETVQKILDAAQSLFGEKGYDHTSIQDIIDVTGLSKGAIYHHFASKEEIFDAFSTRLMEGQVEALARLRDDPHRTGLEKLRGMMRLSITDSSQATILLTGPNLLENPKFLAIQLNQLFTMVVPQYMEPIFLEGIADGTIPTQDARMAAEVLMLLCNIWVNPLLGIVTEEDMGRRCRYLDQLLRGMGIELFDEEMIAGMVSYARLRLEAER